MRKQAAYMAKQLWRVVGGEGKGGILIRVAEDLSSAKAEPERLATGSLVKELALQGERLNFQLVEGTGPAEGWASIKISGKDLLTRVDDEAPRLEAPRLESQSAVDLAAPPAPLGRKIRVLALHGGGSNMNVMRYQCQELMSKRVLGDSAEWDFINGSRPWQGHDQGDIMKALAAGMPFLGWYGVTTADESERPYTDKLFDISVEFTYEEVDLAAERVLKHIEEKGPFDVLVGFSQGCIVTHLVTGLLRERGRPIPWRLGVFFCGMSVRDNRYRRLFDEPIDHPTVMIFGKADPFHAYGKTSQEALYVNPVVLEHEEDHKFPAARNECGQQIYQRVKQEVFWQCGLLPIRPEPQQLVGRY